MIPSDFKLRTLYGQGFDWPISYDELEPYYCEAESEIAATGRVVVLAAHAIETPRILLLSTGLANGSQTVGRYLMDHPSKMSYGLAREPLFPFRGPPSTSGIDVLRDGPFRSKRGAFRTTLRNDGWTWPTGSPRGGATDFALSPTQPVSVVDSQCRAHEHDNLFIVGSGVFPTSATANPTLTVAALALRAVKAIQARLAP